MVLRHSDAFGVIEQNGYLDRFKRVVHWLRGFVVGVKSSMETDINGNNCVKPDGVKSPQRTSGTAMYSTFVLETRCPIGV